MKSSTSTSEKRSRLRTEQAYVISAVTALRRLNVPYAWEAALLGRSVDLAYLHDGAVCTVEFKKKDWRRALAQAHDHLLGADFAYICLAEQVPTAELLTAAHEAGIGVLAFSIGTDWPFEVVMPATRSNETWVVARDRLVQQLKAA